MIQYVTKLMVSNEPNEFIFALNLWGIYRPGNIMRSLMSIHRMVACRTYFFSWRCVLSAFIVHCVQFHQYPLKNRLLFLNQKPPSWSLGISSSSPKGCAITNRGDIIMPVVCTAKMTIIQTIESDPTFSRIRRRLFELMVEVGPHDSYSIFSNAGVG